MFNLFAAFLIWVGRGWCTWRKRVRIIERDCRMCEGAGYRKFDSGHVCDCFQCGGAGKEPYLIRYALFGWLPGDKRRASWLPNIYLHNILLPDSDTACHNHPWPWAWSLILRGGYTEDRLRWYDAEAREVPPNGVQYTRQAVRMHFYEPGNINKLKAGTFHRISEVEQGGMWSLFITSGGPRQTWGFAVPGQGFVRHADRHGDYSRQAEPKFKSEFQCAPRQFDDFGAEMPCCGECGRALPENSVCQVCNDLEAT